MQATASPTLSLQLLGAPRIAVDGDPLAVDTRKATALLAYLAVTGRPHERESLAALLWPDADHKRARAALRRTLSALAKGLEGRWLETDRSTVALAEDGVDLDVAAFDRHLAAARATSDPDERLAQLTAAVTVARGDFLAGFSLRDSPEFDDWQFFTAETLRRELAAGLEELVEGCVEIGDLHAAIAHARRWLSLDTLHEPAHRRLMELYGWTGRREAALRQYRECLRALHRELGVSPLSDTTALYQAIKEGRAPDPPAPRRSQRLSDQAPPRQPIAPPRVPRGADANANGPVASGTRMPLIGRQAEQAALGAAHTAATSGALAAIEGEAGSGKSRLAEEVVAGAADQGAATVLVRCYEGEQHLAFSAVVDLVRGVLPRLDTEVDGAGEVPGHWWAEAARLLPDLAPRAPGGVAAPGEAPGAPTRLFEALTGLLEAGLSGDPPGVLVIDDAHWLDAACLDLLAYLINRLEGMGVLVVLAWRSELVDETHRLRWLLRVADAAGRATHVALERLPHSAVRELAAEASLPDDPDAVQRVVEATEGVPLFVVHYLAALAADREASWAHGDVALLLDARIAAVDETARQLLTTAAVIGRWFDVDTLRVASGRGEEETVEGLERLVAAGLVREGRPADGTEEGGYDFAHEQLRARALAGVTLARRRLLHRRVAAALESHTRGRRETPGLRGQIAWHLHEAGDDRGAAEAYARAGDSAREVHANTEAMQHYRSALGLGHPDAATLHEHLGDLRTLIGDYVIAATEYETAAALAEPSRVPALEHKLAGLHQRAGAWELARSHLDDALAHLDAVPAAGSDMAGLRARIVADQSLVARANGDDEQARDLAATALELARAAGDDAARAQARNLLGILATAAGEPAEAIGQLEASRSLAERLDDKAARAAATNNLAIALRAAGEHEVALTLAREAAGLAAEIGDRHREAATQSNLADALHALGRNGDAEWHVRRAAELLVQIAADDDTPAPVPRPEIWSLTSW